MFPAVSVLRRQLTKTCGDVPQGIRTPVTAVKGRHCRLRPFALWSIAPLHLGPHNAWTNGLRIRFLDGQATVSLGAGDSVRWTRCIFSASRASAEGPGSLDDPPGSIKVHFWSVAL